MDSDNDGRTQVAQAQAPDHDTAGDVDSIQAIELLPLAGPPSVMNVIVVAAECARTLVKNWYHEKPMLVFRFLPYTGPLYLCTFFALCQL